LATSSAFTYDGSSLLVGATSSSGTGNNRLQVGSSNGTTQLLLKTSTGHSATYVTGVNVYQTWASGAFYALGIAPADGSSFTERARIDSAGNLGLGVIPSAWGTGQAMDWANYGAINTFDDGLKAQIQIGYNYYQTSPSAFVYKVGDAASIYRQRAGVHSWFNAGTGTAGNSISFTQAMTLDSSGRLQLGTTSAYNGERLVVDSNGGNVAYNSKFVNSSTSSSVYASVTWSVGEATTAIGYIGTGGSAVGNVAFRNNFVIGTQNSTPLVFNTVDAEKMRLDTSGNLGLGTSSPTKRLQFGTTTGGAVASPITFQFADDYSSGYTAAGAKLVLYGVSTAETYGIGTGPASDIQYHAGGAGNTLGRHAWYSGNSEKMRLNASGQLAVGTSTAANGALLTLRESATNSGALSMTNRNNTQTWLLAVDATAVDDKILAFIDSTNSAVRMSLDANGSLLIGFTSSPSSTYKFYALDSANIYTSNDTGGTTTLRLGSSNSMPQGIANIAGIKTAAGSGVLTFATGSGGVTSEVARLDASGNFLLGNTSVVYSSKLTVAYDPVSNNGPIFLDNRSYGVNKGGLVWFGGQYNSSNAYRPFGGVGALKENATDGNSAGFLVFSTNGNNADATERARITSNGVLDLATGAGAVGQIQFPATQVASSNVNTLDDYEEGTWTPNLSGSGGGSYTMGGSNGGNYIKIGKMVWATATLQWTGQTTAYSGNLWVAGLPFTAAGCRSIGSLGAVSGGLAFTSGYGEWNYLIDPGYSSVYIIQNSTTGSGYSHGPTVSTTGLVYAITIVYQASS
jgi:hypothetical protein